MDNQKLHNAKLLGGIGSILMLLMPIPAAGWLIALVGFILVLVAIKYLGDELKDHNIFTNYLYAFIIILIGVVIFAVIMIFTVFTTIGPNMTAFQNITSPQQFYNLLQTKGVVQFFVSLAAALLVLWILLIVSAIFLRKSFNKIASDTHTHLFHTSGLLYLIGAATVILLVGFVIIFVAFIIQIIAFFSLPETLSATPMPMPPGTPPQ